MASGGERPDLEALSELEEVLQHLESELASWRRRAMTAEQRATDLAATGPDGKPMRLESLETENQAIGRRLEQAKTRVADLIDRLQFLEQQRGNGGSR